MKEIFRIKLLRNLSQINIFDKDEVKGYLYITGNNSKNQFKLYKIPTLENRNYVLQDGVYTLVHEYSPKFKRKLWELYDTPNRTEIKFHLGSDPDHSRGCILLGDTGLTRLHSSLDSRKTYSIEVKSI